MGQTRLSKGSALQTSLHADRAGISGDTLHPAPARDQVNRLLGVCVKSRQRRGMPLLGAPVADSP